MKVSCPKGWKPIAWRRPNREEHFLDFTISGKKLALASSCGLSPKVILERNLVPPQDLQLGQEGFFGGGEVPGTLQGYRPDGSFPYYDGREWFSAFLIESEETEFDLELEAPRGYQVCGFRKPERGETYLDLFCEELVVRPGPHQYPRPILEKQEEFSQYDLGNRFKFSDFGQWWSESTLQGILLGPEERTVFLDTEGRKWFICKRIES